MTRPRAAQGEREQCKERVATGHYPPTRPCDRFAVRDGYCKQHHPDAKAERRRKINEKVSAQLADMDRAWKIRLARDAVVEAAKLGDSVELALAVDALRKLETDHE